MFDNQQKKPQGMQQPQRPDTQPVTPQGPSALDAGLIKPKEGADEVVDIFEGVNTGGATPQKSPQPMQTAAPQKRGGRKIVLGVLIAIIVVLVAVGAWLIYMSLQTQPVPASEAQPTTPSVPDQTTTPVATEDVTTPDVTTPTTTPEVDSDGDGLSDATENNLGTSATNADSDGDGLFDREEVEVYLTDPLNPDTDGDGFNDGTEVQNGYNPNGSGTLLEAGFQS